jgi:hypothetical protein
MGKTDNRVTRVSFICLCWLPAIVVLNVSPVTAVSLTCIGKAFLLYSVVYEVSPLKPYITRPYLGYILRHERKYFVYFSPTLVKSSMV